MPDSKNQNHVLSVIVPTRNEATTLPTTLERVWAGGADQVIVVDGQSGDQTVEVALAHNATVIQTRPGRGIQLRTGAKRAKGDILLFLHADTLPPEDYRQEIEKTLRDPMVVAGAFGFELDQQSLKLRLVAWLTRWRSSILGRPYGDQGLFLSRTNYNRTNGYPKQRILEDVEMVRRLHRLGRIAITEKRAVTSARRWVNRGVLRTFFTHRLIVLGYTLGISAERLAAFNAISQKRLSKSPPIGRGVRSSSQPA